MIELTIELLKAAGEFITDHGLPNLISIVTLWMLVREIPKQRSALTASTKESRDATERIATENRSANAAIAEEYKSSIERLFARSEDQIKEVIENTSKLVTAAAHSHAESVRKKDDRITELTELLIHREAS